MGLRSCLRPDYATPIRHLRSMKRFLIVVGSIALTVTQLTWAQPGRPPGQGGAGGRWHEERRAPREDLRREQVERRQERLPSDESGGRQMSPDERRELRQQIRDHGRSIYRDRQ